MPRQQKLGKNRPPKMKSIKKRLKSFGYEKQHVKEYLKANKRDVKNRIEEAIDEILEEDFDAVVNDDVYYHKYFKK